ncbi:MAG: NlpC/P60 family protein [Bacteroides sp.]|nr:NlpC/P60 family protein [Bacteroides sp.]
MKKHFLHAALLIFIIAGLSSCKTSAPKLNYRALAKASLKLGMDINLDDNHNLYIESAEWIGTRYKYGGDSKRGTDCSGFTMQIYKKVFDTTLGRSTSNQLDQSSKVSKGNLREGDLVFFTSDNSGKKVAHVGIYLKDGKFIHASTSRGVIVSALKETYYDKHWMKGGRIK